MYVKPGDCWDDVIAVNSAGYIAFFSARQAGYVVFGGFCFGLEK
jgi:hypothetical protein